MTLPFRKDLEKYKDLDEDELLENLSEMELKQLETVLDDLDPEVGDSSGGENHLASPCKLHSSHLHHRVLLFSWPPHLPPHPPSLYPNELAASSPLLPLIGLVLRSCSSLLMTKHPWNVLYLEGRSVFLARPSLYLLGAFLSDWTDVSRRFWSLAFWKVLIKMIWFLSAKKSRSKQSALHCTVEWPRRYSVCFN